MQIQRGDVVQLRNPEVDVEPTHVPAFVTTVYSPTSLELTYFFPGQAPQTGTFSEGPGYGEWSVAPSGGSYTPDVLGIENASGVTANKHFWVRQGGVVQVHGSANVQATLAGTTGFRVSLPVPSNLAAPGDLAGSGTQDVILVGASGPDEALASFSASAPGTVLVSYSFAYEVV